MQRAVDQRVFQRFARFRRTRRVQTISTLVLVALAPVLVFTTLWALGLAQGGLAGTELRLVLLADLVYILVVAYLVLARVARIVSERRSDSAGSKLHLRLSGLFALSALIPTVSVAVFAGLTLNVGLEGWFSDRVRLVVGNSLAAAEAYQEEQERDLTEDTLALAAYLEAARQAFPLIDDGQLRQLLSQAQGQVQRGLRVAFVIDGDGTIRARGERSYLFDFSALAPEDFTRARETGITLIKDWRSNEFRALVPLDTYLDRYLYVARAVDGDILSLLDETRETVRLYQQMERERGRLLFDFGLLYLGFAVILMLAAIWLGLSFAERLSRPIGRLAAAAARVGGGDFDAQVREEPGDDEIATMGRVFNQMTGQLKKQRETLLENNRQIEARRRLFDSVLGSVTAGVIGLDAEGRVQFINRAAERLLGCEGAVSQGTDMDAVAPEFVPLLARLRDAPVDVGRVQDEVRLSRDGRLESLLVRIAGRMRIDGTLEGYVIAFDDVTDLVSAQRMAAWGDVARRIAHEIKNPLTPIQLSAERIKRKFRPMVGAEADTLDQLADVIIRQTNDLRAIVDEFSKFARMREPDRRPHDLAAILRDAILLQETAQPGVAFNRDIPEGPLTMEIDATMLSQAFTNLIKNGVEATESHAEKAGKGAYAPQLQITLRALERAVVITIADNGVGLPQDRARLFEPYVTTRDKGTGLGLSIVKKIIEEHGGTLQLIDAQDFSGQGRAGAMAEIRLPLLNAARTATD
ncbi:sensor histidine kinase NtrY-like [Roseicitreum antarcticum]|uniref:histidine kinase n=1 Tax=Roseicitreum antarcticum TaxID=564137 RepID=A0A1H3C568_9RHOB|nr:PAS domain-containing sensor histidine kinase [Roseicitreum antarcticum]SDX49180.1 two-component system, NtrC family, nitrogen regulation sensor histidine kinase NtrY [Roseicitreum antarcticum]